MERNNNTYGELINNKFCELLSADSAQTWPAMKELLDKKMPEKKKRKWLIWFTTKTGIISIVLFALFASAAGSYMDLRQQNNKTDNEPAKEMNSVVVGENSNLKNETSINKNINPEKINFQPEKKAKTSLPPAVKIKDRRTMRTAEIHQGKTNSTTARPTQLIPAAQNKDTLAINPVIIPVASKDSISGSAALPLTEKVERKRAF